MIRGMVDGFIDAGGNIAILAGLLWAGSKISDRLAARKSNPNA